MFANIIDTYVLSISPDKARKGVIYAPRTGVYALVEISERTFTRLNVNKWVRYSFIKIPVHTFHSFVSFANKHWCTLVTIVQLLSANLNYKQRLSNVMELQLYDSRFVSYCLSV